MRAVLWILLIFSVLVGFQNCSGLVSHESASSSRPPASPAISASVGCFVPSRPDEPALIAESAFALEPTIMNVSANIDRDVLTADANLQAILRNDNSVSGIDANGAFGGNSESKIAMRGLAIEAQRNAWDVIAKAVLDCNFESARVGLRALQWSFDPLVAGERGNWPNQDGEGEPTTMATLHNKSVFLYAALRALHLLKVADFRNASALENAQFQDEVNSLIQDAAKSARWMADADDTEKFFTNAVQKGKQTNQLFFIGMALVQAGILVDDRVLIAKGQSRLNQAIAMETADGTLPEGSGNPNGFIFDSSYQTVSLEVFGRYFATLAPSPYRDRLQVLLQKATDRFLKVVDSSGAIDTSANSRTEACEPAQTGAGITKGWAIDVLPFRVRYLGFLLNKSAEYNPIADKIMWIGYEYDHFGCGS